VLKSRTAQSKPTNFNKLSTKQIPKVNGGAHPPMNREVFIAADAVIVLPYDPVTDRVLLIEQFRLPAYARGDAWPWTLEAVAGRQDAGETPEETARREAREEAGVDLFGLEKVASFYPSTGALTEYNTVYVGLADLSDHQEHQAGLAEEGEDIRAFTVPADTALAMLEDGQANAGPLIIARNLVTGPQLVFMDEPTGGWMLPLANASPLRALLERVNPR
jgi:ADP-ribose pyrophosphatase